MSAFARFMKANKKPAKQNEKYAATRSLCDESGKPLEWEFKHISTEEHESIKEECNIDVPVAGKPNLYRPKLLTGKYISKLIVESVVVPDLYDKELQDSYSVTTPEDLLMAMVDDPGEYNALTTYVQQLQGFNVSFSDQVEEAKN